MKKVLIRVVYLFTFLILLSCVNDNKITCSTTKVDLLKCSSVSDTSFSIYLDDSSRLVMMLLKDSVQQSEWRKDSFKAKFSEVKFHNKINRENFIMKFSINGKLLYSKKQFFNLSEWYSRRKSLKNNINYTVYQNIPNLKISFNQCFFTLNNLGDTLPNYLYYSYNENKKSYRVHTDINDFTDVDSILINYFEGDVSDEIFEIEDENILPNIEYKTPYQRKNSFNIIYEKQRKVIADLWGFNHKKNPSFSHALLVLNGDLLSRMAIFRKQADKYEKEYAKGTIKSIPSLRTKLESTGVFINENDELEFDENLKEAILKVDRTSVKLNL